MTKLISIPFQQVLDELMYHYTNRVPDVKIMIDGMIKEGLIHQANDIENDHIAFRTLGTKHLGIKSLEKIFIHYGYVPKDDYFFEQKKLNARWYQPPSFDLPRIFISELRVNDLSENAKTIIHKYTNGISQDPVDSLNLDDTKAVGDFLHSPLWDVPYLSEYQTLEKESEYAAWVIYNRYYLNHYTISVHSLPKKNSIDEFSDFIESIGLILNLAGNRIKISKDGLLKQSSTKSKLIQARFKDENEKAIYHNISGSYIEFAERLPLPEFSHLPKEKLKREYLRDGFEASNADKIFESTFRSSN